MANSRAGDSRLIFGCTDEPFGYVTAVEVSSEPEKAEAKNGQGGVPAVEYFNKIKKVKGTYYFLTGGTGDPLSKVGDGTDLTLTDAGIAIKVDKASKARQVGQFAVVNFEGTYYPDLVNS